jgi:hypothetical protein
MSLNHRKFFGIYIKKKGYFQHSFKVLHHMKISKEEFYDQ